MTEELKRTAFVAQCGTCARGSRRRRASLQDLFTLAICSELSWEVLCLPGGAVLLSTDKRLQLGRANIQTARHLVVSLNESFFSVIRVLYIFA